MKTEPKTLSPLTGIMDSRSDPDSMVPKSHRFKLNMSVDEDGRLVRSPGWARFLDNLNTDYTNEDWHDQGDCLNPSPDREDVTLLFESVSTGGTRRFFLGTSSRVAVLNQRQGTWTTIARNLGPASSSTAVRFKVATLGNDLVFANGIDAPRVYTAGTQPAECGEGLLAEIQELKDDIKLTKANYVVSFSGYIVLLGTTEDGTEYNSRVRWSGLNDAKKWFATTDPGTGQSDTTAGFQDLPYGTRILGAAELLNSLYIFTNQSIYRMSLQGGSGSIFGFTRVYTQEGQQDRCLVFPNTLVETGEDIWYMGREGIYRYNPFMRIPERTEWIHKGSNQIYDYLDRTCCEAPVGGYDAKKKEVWMSFPKVGDKCANTRSFVFNIRYRTSHVVDHGFTAFGNFRSDTGETFAQWLQNHCTDDLTALCAQIGSQKAIDFCVGAGDEGSGTTCNEEQVFCGASAQDKCVKEIGDVWVREQCLNADTGQGTVADDVHTPFEGTYVSNGYISILRGVFAFKTWDKQRLIDHFLIEHRELADEDDPPYGRLRIGYANDAREPNGDNPLAISYTEDAEMVVSLEDTFSEASAACMVVWNNQDLKQLLCPLPSSDARSQKINNLKAGLGTEWALWYKDRFLFYEFSVVGRDTFGKLTEPTGGALIFSRLEAHLSK